MGVGSAEAGFGEVGNFLQFHNIINIFLYYLSMLTSITLSKDDPFELSKKMIEYFIKNNIRKVEIILINESERNYRKEYGKADFDNLEGDIRDSLLNDGTYFYIEIPNIKTSFEEFSYGIEANSYKLDLLQFFKEVIE